MKNFILFLIFAIYSLQTFAQETHKSEAKAAGKQQVIDVGQLEIEGEIRRPQVTWIDSQKRVNGMLPIFHRSEFLNLEKQLLKPMSKTEASNILSRSAKEGSK